MRVQTGKYTIVFAVLNKNSLSVKLAHDVQGYHEFEVDPNMPVWRLAASRKHNTGQFYPLIKSQKYFSSVWFDEEIALFSFIETKIGLMGVTQMSFSFSLSTEEALSIAELIQAYATEY
jgi:hypothetical protein